MDIRKVHDLSIPDKIGLSAVAVLGKGIAEAAFLLTHPEVKTENKASLSVMVSRWHHSDKAQAFINSVRAGKATLPENDEANDLETRQGLINQLIAATRQTQGKDSISGLQTLAKLQGFDKPDEVNEEEKRIFVLTYLSHCRSCALMREYLKVQDEVRNSTINDTEYQLRGTPSI